MTIITEHIQGTEDLVGVTVGVTINGDYNYTMIHY